MILKLVVDEFTKLVFTINLQGYPTTGQGLKWTVDVRQSKLFPELRWLKTVSSTFQDLELMGHYNHSLSVDATIMVSTNCSIIGEQVVVNFVVQ